MRVFVNDYFTYYIVALNVCTYFMLYVLALKNSTSHLVASYPGYLFLYGEWVNLAIVSSWHWVL